MKGGPPRGGPPFTVPGRSPRPPRPLRLSYGFSSSYGFYVFYGFYGFYGFYVFYGSNL
ncbi:hypothetical protein [Streptomyces viridosporus]|uniref:hypothetical protein n=1 Tax=Streptomyces viridosporus TaxID=67581 RepID=UPI001356F364|nr:hypothetical protein [Streptomyces viridosporus]